MPPVVRTNRRLKSTREVYSPLKIISLNNIAYVKIIRIDIMDFKDAAILGSKIYYNFLNSNENSFKSYDVLNIQFDKIYCYLKLDEKLRSLECLQFRINSILFNDFHIKVISYNEETKILKIAPDEKSGYHLKNATVENIKVVIDLTFLVSNVEEFYKRHCDNLHLPYYNNNINFDDEFLLYDEPSQEQINAIRGALSNPLSYIWGAPGTGKTRFVLARCVLPYIKADKTILIVAPTNNAIEQSLYGILPVLNSFGISSDNVFRMGTASNEFAKKYPMCCENSDIEKKIIKLSTVISDLEKQIKLYPEYQKSIEFEKLFSKCETDVPILFDKLESLYSTIKELNEKIVINEGKITLSKEQIKNLSSLKSKLTSQIETYNLSVKKYSKGLLSKIFKTKYYYYKSKLEESLAELSTTEQFIKNYSKQIDECKKENSEYFNSVQISTTHENELKMLIGKSTSFWDKLSAVAANINIDNLYEKKTTLSNYIEKGKNDLEKRKERYSIFEQDNLSGEYLQTKLDKYKEEYNSILSKSSTSRLLKCKVVATTIDTCISRLITNSDFNPVHIMLDEAGYCPLIKGATLLTYGCPITLFGDHMQLPPICEMEDKSFTYDNETVALYAQSTLYLEDILYDSHIIANRYLNNKPPVFDVLKKFDLNYTYRFGDELANILADYVYSNNFKSAIGQGMQLYCVHCPNFKSEVERVSITECQNLIKYVQSYTDEEIGIITPYKNQYKKIKELFRKNNINKDVFTIHSSQGQEFDTILLSVVDTNKKWFTNTLCNKSNGKNVINTAVSRAKKKLVIFCDVDYWNTQNKQLIKQILDFATQIDLC